MALPIYVRTVVTQTGDIVAGAEFEVIVEATGLDVDFIYSDRNGTAVISSPYFSDGDGLIEFYVAVGTYRVQVTGGSGSFTERYIPLVGTSATTDKGVAVLQKVIPRCYISY